MNERRVNRPMNILANSAGRRDAVRALGMVGMALMAVLDPREDATAKDRARKERGTLQAEKKKGKKREASCIRWQAAAELGKS